MTNNAVHRLAMEQGQHRFSNETFDEYKARVIKLRDSKASRGHEWRKDNSDYLESRGSGDN